MGEREAGDRDGLGPRLHYVIRDGGDQPNVVPSSASVWYYFRETDYAHIKELFELGQTMAQGAAMMTGTKLGEVRILGTAWPGYFNRPIAEAMTKNIQQIGLPKWSEDDQTLAKALQLELKVLEKGLDTALAKLDTMVTDEQNRGGGSDDIGDVSWNVPTIVLRYPSKYPQLARPPLGQCDCDGDPDCPQRCDGGRQSSGDDGAGPTAQPFTSGKCVGVFHQSPDQRPEIHFVASSGRQAGDRLERPAHGKIPRSDAQILLRSHEVQDLLGAARHQVSDRKAIG